MHGNKLLYDAVFDVPFPHYVNGKQLRTDVIGSQKQKRVNMFPLTSWIQCIYPNVWTITDVMEYGQPTE